MRYRRVQLNEIQEDVLIRLLQLPCNTPSHLAGVLNLSGPEIRYYSELRQYLFSGQAKAETHYDGD